MIRLVLALTLCFTVTGCDIINPQHTFRFAVPKSDSFYNLISSQLIPVLSANGCRIETIETPNGIEANKMVANGQADLALVFNHSIILADQIGPPCANLRVVFPLVSSILIAFSKEPAPEDITTKELFSNKRIGIELVDGEAHAGLDRMLTRSEITGYNLVTIDDNPDVVVFWGTYYGKRARKYLEAGWHPYSFRDNWLKFQSLNEPAYSPFSLPSIPGNSRSIELNTLSSNVLLVTNESIGEKAIYELSGLLMGKKLELVHKDIMFRTISESIDRTSLLFPLHEGTYAFLRRDEPTFLERYADAIALVISFIAVMFGAFQAIASKIARFKKEQLDKYFLEFLDIRSKHPDPQLQLHEMEALFHKAVRQLTNEKLEKSDFHILSRLIQQEIANMRATR